MKKLLFTLGSLAGGLLFGATLAIAAAYLVPQGGTGLQYPLTGFKAGSILFGNGTSPLATSTGLQYSSAAQRLTYTYGSTTAESTGTLCLTGDTCRTTWPSGSGGGSGTVSTSTNETAGFLSYWTSNSATPALLGKVATGTVSGSTNIAVTAAQAIIGSGLTISLTGTVPYGNGGTGSTTAPVSQLLYGGATAYQSVATSSLGATGPITFSGTAGAQVGGTAGTYGCTTASSGVAGCLGSTAFDTFNNKQAAITATWPQILTGATLTFGGLSTSTAAVVGNIPYFSGVNTFANVATGTLTATSPLSLSNGTRSLVGGSDTVSIANAAADGSTKGAASFTANDFDASSGNISLDYTNGQKATASVPGFLAAADFATFAAKIGWPWTIANTYGTSTNSTTTPTWYKTALFASSTVGNPSVIDNLVTTNSTTTNATSTNEYVSGQFRNGSGTGLALETSGVFSAYGGSNPCSNQVALSLSASGVIGCTSVTNAMLSNSTLTVTAGGGLLGGGSVALGSSITLTAQVGTSSVPNVGGLAYWTGAGTPSTLGTVATGTVSAGSSAITVTAGRSVVGGALSIDCATAGAGQNGCLSSTDWSTFNSKQATIGVTWPITLSGATVGFNGLSTSTAAVVSNIPYFSGVNTFANVATGTASCTTGASCSSFTVIGSSPSITTTLGTSVDLASEITGRLPFANLTQLSANSVLGNITGSTADGASLATSSLFAGTTGQVDYFASTGGLVGTSSIFISTASKVGIATTTPLWPLNIFANNLPQLALSAGAGIAHWFFANEGGNLYIGTTTTAGTATSTQASALSINGSGAPSLSIGSTTQTLSAVNGLLTRGSNGANGSTTESVGRWQIDMYNSAGTRSCMFVVGTTLTVIAGACNP